MSTLTVYSSGHFYMSELLSAKTSNGSRYGLSWKFTQSFDYPACGKSEKQPYFKWEFDWEEGVDGYEALFIYKRHLKIDDKGVDMTDPIRVKVTKARNVVEHMIDSVGRSDFRLEFEMEMKPIRKTGEVTDLDKNFESSEMTDVVLVVEGKKMHVNKGILSFHSTYFRSLFNSDFKEKSMEEIPIEDVKHSEFARLLSVVHPNPIFATHESCESLLELADRFMMPSVTRHVEHFLLTISNFYVTPVEFQPERVLELANRFELPNVTYHVEKCLMKKSELRFCHVLGLAEKYDLDELFHKMMGWICTKEHMKNIKKSDEYEMLSDYSRRFLFERLVDLC